MASFAKNTTLLRVTVLTVMGTDAEDYPQANGGVKLIPVERIIDIEPTGCGCNNEGKPVTLIKVHGPGNSLDISYGVAEHVDYIQQVTSDCDPCTAVDETEGCP